MENGTGIGMTEVPLEEGGAGLAQDTLCRGSAALVSKAFLIKACAGMMAVVNVKGRRQGRAS